MRTTKFWVLLFGALLALCAALSVFFLGGKTQGKTANIYQNGVCLYSIDLDAVEKPYTLTVAAPDGGRNVIAVEPGRICVSEADCPDGVCVRQGWIENGVTPLVCLPHGLVIRIEDAPGDDPGIDGVTGG